MTKDEIYENLARLGKVDLPADIGNKGQQKITEIQSKIRDGLNFCQTYGSLLNKEMARVNKKLAAAKSEANYFVQEAIKNRKYTDVVKSFGERKFLLETESMNKYDVFNVEAEFMELRLLRDAIRDTASSMKVLKEQISSIQQGLKTEASLAQAGGEYNLTQYPKSVNELDFE